MARTLSATRRPTASSTYASVLGSQGSLRSVTPACTLSGPVASPGGTQVSPQWIGAGAMACGCRASRRPPTTACAPRRNTPALPKTTWTPSSTGDTPNSGITPCAVSSAPRSVAGSCGCICGVSPNPDECQVAGLRQSVVAIQRSAPKRYVAAVRVLCVSVRQLAGHERQPGRVRIPRGPGFSRSTETVSSAPIRASRRHCRARPDRGLHPRVRQLRDLHFFVRPDLPVQRSTEREINCAEKEAGPRPGWTRLVSCVAVANLRGARSAEPRPMPSMSCQRWQPAACAVASDDR